MCYRNMRLSRHTKKDFSPLSPQAASPQSPGGAALSSVILMKAAAFGRLFPCISEMLREGAGQQLMHGGLCRALQRMLHA